MITFQLNEGDDYKKMRKITTINLLDFNYFPTNQYHTTYHLVEKTLQIPYPNLLELHFIEMKKFNTLWRNGSIQKDDQLAKWIRFISNEDDTQWNEIAEEHPIMKKAVKRLKAISQDPENRLYYEMREKAMRDLISIKNGAKEEGMKQGLEEGIKKGIKQGLEQGIVKGIEQGMEQVAIKMLQEGMEIEKVMKLTGLPVETIHQLQKQLN